MTRSVECLYPNKKTPLLAISLSRRNNYQRKKKAQLFQRKEEKVYTINKIAVELVSESVKDKGS